MFDDIESALGSLNPSQREAAAHGEGPMLIVAGAGTGKTLTLAARTAWLIASGTPPERILLLTFTRRAAREMLRRAESLTGREATGRAWGGTFHATANRLLRRYGRALGLPPDFTIMDQADAADLMNLIRGELGLGKGPRRFPRKDTLAAIYSSAVNSGTKLGPVLRDSFPWCAEEIDGIRDVFARYTRSKRDHGVLDYDDLLLYWKALAHAPGVGETVGRLFDHVLVDEYQDTNALQAEILQGMRREIRNLTVVGDDAQAIYSFRSATNRNILEFASDFLGARIVTLEQNYRSTSPLLAVSNAVIALSSERHKKTLWSNREGERRPLLLTCLDETEQCDAVCRHVLEHREEGVPLRRQAVLFRAAHHSDQLEVELARRNIPFVKYGGLKFLEAAHVKDALAMLRILENPHDRMSWFRVLQLVDGVGPAHAMTLMAGLGVGEREASPSPLARLVEEEPSGLPSAVAAELGQLRSALADCAAMDGPAPQIERLSRFLEPVVARRYSRPRERLRDLEQLEHIAARSPSRARFLSDLTLDPPDSTGDLAGPPLLDDDYLVLSTIHSAKGCEWDVVHVIHAADGMIPSDMATGRPEQIEEERRLLYVGLTRARDALYVYFPLRYYRRPRGLEDAHSFAQLTRFLPEPVCELFDRRCTYQGDPQDFVLAVAAGPAEGVDRFLANLWKG